MTLAQRNLNVQTTLRRTVYIGADNPFSLRLQGIDYTTKEVHDKDFRLVTRAQVLLDNNVILADVTSFDHGDIVDFSAGNGIVTFRLGALASTPQTPVDNYMRFRVWEGVLDPNPTVLLNENGRFERVLISFVEQ